MRTNGLRLPPQVRDLAIDYTALSLVAPEKVHFRYKLEGQDKDWREVVNDRQVQYTNLAAEALPLPRHGVQRQRGVERARRGAGFRDSSGVVSDELVLRACVALFLAMLWGIYQLRVRQLAHQFNACAGGAGRRTHTGCSRPPRHAAAKLSRRCCRVFRPDLHVAGRVPATPVKCLKLRVDHAAQAITEGRDAVQGLRMSTVEKNDLAVAIRTVGEELASAETNQSSPNFNVVVEGTSRNLHPILRDEVYRLAAEALRNAFRHAAAQNVEVEIRYDEKYFRLRVRDDGKGIRLRGASRRRT